MNPHGLLLSLQATITALNEARCTIACSSPGGMDGVRLWRERGQW